LSIAGSCALTCAAAIGALSTAVGPLVAVSGPPAQDVRYEHRVVVPTTALDSERDVEASLERNVNRLAAAGFELSAFVGGDPAVIDALLGRKAYVAGRVDHAGQVFVVMTRPVGRTVPPREYRLLHTRTPRGTDAIVAGLGEQGYHLTVTANSGGVFHAAFERGAAGGAVDYRVFANRGRTSWMAQIEQDAAALSRLTRVVPMGLDFALAELGPAGATPAALEWFSAPAHTFASQDARVQARASEGYQVQVVRVRNTTIDVLLVRPAGAGGAARPAYSLEDGPWGGPCGRGVIAGADVHTDGDVYCVADTSASTISNRGIDVVVRAEGTRSLFDVPTCEDRARLGSSRPVDLRLVAAAQLERVLNGRIEEGYRVTRALAGSDGQGTRRLSFFTSRLPVPPGRPGSAPVGPALRADRDELLESSVVSLEEQFTDALRRDPSLGDALVWVEVHAAAGMRQVRLAGCASTRLEREAAERVLRGLLVRTTAADYRVRNDVIVDRWR
jgi:hypothetical protein